MWTSNRSIISPLPAISSFQNCSVDRKLTKQLRLVAAGWSSAGDLTHKVGLRLKSDVGAKLSSEVRQYDLGCNHSEFIIEL